MNGGLITLTRHIIEQQRRHPEATGKFTDLMNDIAFASKMISYHTNKAGLLNILGSTGKINIQGEVVRRLDSFAHETMINALSRGGNFCALASEEKEKSIPVRDYIDHIKKPDRESGRPLSLRYIGSMVSDIHRNLLYGGIFMYPATASAPKGKLRLMYESNPIAFIYDQDGGTATDGDRNILDVVPMSIHHRTPVFLGPVYDINVLKEFLRPR